MNKFSQKTISSFLLLTMIGIFSFQAINYLSSNGTVFTNSTYIETVNDSAAKIHYGKAMSPNSDILFSKEPQGENFKYVISDFKTNKELYSFSSSQDINLNIAETSENHSMNAVAWAIVNAVTGNGDPVSAVLGVIGGLGNIATISTIITDLTAAAAMGGFTAVKLCMAILLSSSAAIPIIAAGGGAL